METKTSSAGPEANQPASGLQKARWLVIAAILSVAALLYGVDRLFPGNQPPALPPERLTEYPMLGSPDAPIRIVEYSDFACISCRMWHQAGVRDRLLERYGDQIVFIWRDFAATSARSPKAAEAGQCAHDQGSFWAYHDYLFENVHRLYSEDLKQAARQIGLDGEEFDRCLDSGKYQPMVQAGVAEARALGFRGTPTFDVNGEIIVGPPPLHYLIELIDPILAMQ